MRISDWSSDMCSSDLTAITAQRREKSALGGDGAMRWRMVDRAEQRDRPGIVGAAFDPDRALRRRRKQDARFLHRPDVVHSQRSEEHTSELQSLMRISYAVFCLKKKSDRSNTYTIKEAP